MSAELTMPRTGSPRPGRSEPRGASRGRTIAAGIALNTLLVLVALVSVFPLYWALSTAFLPADEINGGAQRLFVHQPTLENFRGLFTATRFFGAMGNSALVSVVVTVAGTFFAALAGYAFAKLRFRGRNGLFLLMLATLMVPPMVTVPVNFVLMAKLGLLDTLWAVILPQLTPAFGIFWMRQYALTTVSDQVLEAARIDGCGEFRIFWRVVFPMLRPAVAGLGIYLFMASWNQLLLPLTYLQSSDKQTYPVFLNGLNNSYAVPQHNLAVAASVLSIIPLLAIFLFGQRHFVRAVTAGAVKE